MSICVYINRDEIKAVKGSGNSKKLKIESFAEHKLQDDSILEDGTVNAESVAQSLTDLWNEWEYPKRGVKLVLDIETALIKPMNVPVLPEHDIRAHITQELTASAAGDSKLLCDYYVLKPHTEDGALILAEAIERKTVKSYISAFRKAKIKPDKIELPMQ